MKWITRERPKIVRRADTSRLDLTPQSAGLYAWDRHTQHEAHSWPPDMATRGG